MDSSLVAPDTQTNILQAFSRALRREAHVLTQEPDLLWQQMYNRLQWEGKQVKKRLVRELAERKMPEAKLWVRMKTPHRESGALVRTIEGHTHSVDACAISPNGRMIVTASSDKTLILWDLPSGQRLHTMRGHLDFVNACGFSPDGLNIVSGSTDRSLRIWDTASGQLLRTLDGHTQAITDCCFSPDSNLIISASRDN